jgi:hypothetical protein
MARINISEFQFAFTFFHHYCNLNKNRVHRFLIPSLQQEGSTTHPAAGADLVVNDNLFFQFKMPDYLSTLGASEIKKKQLPKSFLNYFRFYIKNAPVSCQFNTLLAVAKRSKNKVRYIAPLFHSEADFSAFFQSSPQDALKMIISVDFKQFCNSDPGLDQTDNHKICYSIKSVNDHSLGYLFSQPKKIEVKKGIERLRSKGLSGDLEDYVAEYTLPKQIMDFPTTVGDMIESLKKTIGLNNNESYTLEQMQRELIIKYDIFWMPVVQSEEQRVLLEKMNRYS